MNLNEDFGVTPSKVEALRAKIIQLRINPAEIVEQFIRGSGKGGQKINKTNNCVLLRYGDIVIRCQDDRRRTVNRFLALRELVDRVERVVSPATSATLAKENKARAAAQRSARRARARHRSSSISGAEERNKDTIDPS